MTWQSLPGFLPAPVTPWTGGVLHTVGCPAASWPPPTGVLTISTVSRHCQGCAALALAPFKWLQVDVQAVGRGVCRKNAHPWGTPLRAHSVPLGLLVTGPSASDQHPAACRCLQQGPYTPDEALRCRCAPVPPPPGAPSRDREVSLAILEMDQAQSNLIFCGS